MTCHCRSRTVSRSRQKCLGGGKSLWIDILKCWLNLYYTVPSLHKMMPFPYPTISQSDNQTSLPIQSPWIWEHDLMAWPGVSIKYASLTCKLFGFCSLYIVMINLCCWKDCSVNLQYSKHHEFNHMSTSICHGSILWYDMLIQLFLSICNFGSFPLY